MTCSVLKVYGSSPDISVLSILKNSQLSTFSISANTDNNLIVTTDSDCRVCWIDMGAI